MRANDHVHLGPLLTAGALLGAGLGSALEIIVLHHVLQWHHLLSSWIKPFDVTTLEINVGWDGLYLALAWIATVVGVAMLFHAAHRADVPWSRRGFVGALALGWGTFGFAEGVVGHQLLQMHHVHPGGEQATWDIVFLLLALLLIGVGLRLIQEASHQAHPDRPRGHSVPAGLES